MVNFQDTIYRHIRALTHVRPSIALVLGSGLGNFAERISPDLILNTSDIPQYPVGSVQGHAGRIIFGRLQSSGRKSLPLVLFQGRVHYYEVGQIDKVTLPVEIAHALGATRLLVTNAAGGINQNFRPGQLMLITDTLNLVRKYPLAPSSREHRTSESSGLDPRLQSLFREAAQDLAIPLQEGTYCWLQGPSYETAAEIRMLKKLSVDAVGMSTVPEVNRARSLGMRVAGISLISNLATGLSTSKLSHQEVTETAKRSQESFSALMENVILRIR